MLLELHLEQIMSDKKIAELEGHYFEEKDFKYIIKEDVDVYRIDSKGQSHLLLKLRKKVIPPAISKKAFKALIEEAKKPHTNRGAAAGLLTQRKLPPYVKGIVTKTKFRGKYIGHDDRIRKDDISNISRSSIIGYYDQADRNRYRKKTKSRSILKVPCRMTKFTKEYPDKWKDTIPLFKIIDKQFKILCPEKHQKQLERASKTPEYQIDTTAFSTGTINYNWQTALHRDAGDFEDGFGNLIVLENAKKNKQDWTGCYIGFPQYNVAVEVREGDFLAMDVHQWHANTPLIPLTSLSSFPPLTSMKKKKQEEYTRLSVVSYLRKNMIKCVIKL
uniref:2OGFeDO JBP1/TET oxygenase domain-containing protein n=1 Tax=viral metagenome TaxID=1070528 RepID=A0A6C0E5Z9_9ZZZZ